MTDGTTDQITLSNAHRRGLHVRRPPPPPTPEKEDDTKYIAISLRSAKQLTLPKPVARVSSTWSRSVLRSTQGNRNISKVTTHDYPLPLSADELSGECGYWTVFYTRGTGKQLGQSKMDAPPLDSAHIVSGRGLRERVHDAPSHGYEVVMSALRTDAERYGLVVSRVLYLDRIHRIYAPLTPAAMLCNTLSSYFVVFVEVFGSDGKSNQLLSGLRSKNQSPSRNQALVPVTKPEEAALIPIDQTAYTETYQTESKSPRANVAADVASTPVEAAAATELPSAEEEAAAQALDETTVHDFNSATLDTQADPVLGLPAAEVDVVEEGSQSDSSQEQDGSEETEPTHASSVFSTGGLSGIAQQGCYALTQRVRMRQAAREPQPTLFDVPEDVKLSYRGHWHLIYATHAGKPAGSSLVLSPGATHSAGLSPRLKRLIPHPTFREICRTIEDDAMSRGFYMCHLMFRDADFNQFCILTPQTVHHCVSWTFLVIVSDTSTCSGPCSIELNKISEAVLDASAASAASPLTEKRPITAINADSVHSLVEGDAQGESPRRNSEAKDMDEDEEADVPERTNTAPLRPESERDSKQSQGEDGDEHPINSMQIAEEDKAAGGDATRPDGEEEAAGADDITEEDGVVTKTSQPTTAAGDRATDVVVTELDMDVDVDQTGCYALSGKPKPRRGHEGSCVHAADGVFPMEDASVAKGFSYRGQWKLIFVTHSGKFAGCANVSSPALRRHEREGGLPVYPTQPIPRPTYDEVVEVVDEAVDERNLFLYHVLYWDADFRHFSTLSESSITHCVSWKFLVIVGTEKPSVFLGSRGVQMQSGVEGDLQGGEEEDGAATQSFTLSDELLAEIAAHLQTFAAPPEIDIRKIEYIPIKWRRPERKASDESSPTAGGEETGPHGSRKATPPSGTAPNSRDGRHRISDRSAALAADDAATAEDAPRSGHLVPRKPTDAAHDSELNSRPGSGVGPQGRSGAASGRGRLSDEAHGSAPMEGADGSQQSGAHGGAAAMGKGDEHNNDDSINSPRERGHAASGSEGDEEVDTAGTLTPRKSGAVGKSGSRGGRPPAIPGTGADGHITDGSVTSPLERRPSRAGGSQSPSDEEADTAATMTPPRGLKNSEGGDGRGPMKENDHIAVDQLPSPKYRACESESMSEESRAGTGAGRPTTQGRSVTASGLPIPQPRSAAGGRGAAGSPDAERLGEKGQPISLDHLPPPKHRACESESPSEDSRLGTGAGPRGVTASMSPAQEEAARAGDGHIPQGGPNDAARGLGDEGDARDGRLGGQPISLDGLPPAQYRACESESPSEDSRMGTGAGRPATHGRIVTASGLPIPQPKSAGGPEAGVAGRQPMKHERLPGEPISLDQLPPPKHRACESESPSEDSRLGTGAGPYGRGVGGANRAAPVMPLSEFDTQDGDSNPYGITGPRPMSARTDGSGSELGNLSSSEHIPGDCTPLAFKKEHPSVPPTDKTKPTTVVPQGRPPISPRRPISGRSADEDSARRDDVLSKIKVLSYTESGTPDPTQSSLPDSRKAGLPSLSSRFPAVNPRLEPSTPPRVALNSANEDSKEELPSLSASSHGSCIR